jgi:predicted alpha/beta hydrolase
MKTEDIRFRTEDGLELPATAFVPPAPRAAVVVATAMGVPRQFYRRFATALAQRQIAVLTFDYRGVGDAAAAGDPRRVSLEAWGRHDLQAALAQGQQRFAGLPLFLLGHSVGTQLVGLAPLSESLAGMVLVAGSSPNYRQYRGASRVGTWLWTHVIVPLGSRGRWFPARRLRFSTVDVPAGVARQWGAWARSRRYLFSPEHGLDTERYRRLRCAGLAISIADDPLAPRSTMRALLEEYPQVKFELRHVRPQELGVKAIGHAGFFREAFRDSLWRDTADWILAAAARGVERAA